MSNTLDNKKKMDRQTIMRNRLKQLIKENKMSWAKLADQEELTRGSLQIKVERWANELNHFVNKMGYEVIFKKK